MWKFAIYLVIWPTTAVYLSYFIPTTLENAIEQQFCYEEHVLVANRTFDLIGKILIPGFLFI